MQYDITIRNEPAHPVAVLRFRAGQFQLSQVIPKACGDVWNFIRANNIAGAGRHVAIYYDGVINIECGVEIDGAFPSDGRVVASQTPAGLIATTTHFGPYDQLGDAHRAIVDTSRSRGYELAGPNWEIYGHMTGDPHQARTDVYYLLKS